jgi:hypothetical protein
MQHSVMKLVLMSCSVTLLMFEVCAQLQRAAAAVEHCLCVAPLLLAVHLS